MLNHQRAMSNMLQVTGEDLDLRHQQLLQRLDSARAALGHQEVALGRLRSEVQSEVIHKAQLRLLCEAEETALDASLQALASATSRFAESEVERPT